LFLINSTYSPLFKNYWTSTTTTSKTTEHPQQRHPYAFSFRAPRILCMHFMYIVSQYFLLFILLYSEKRNAGCILFYFSRFYGDEAVLFY